MKGYSNWKKRTNWYTKYGFKIIKNIYRKRTRKMVERSNLYANVFRQDR